MNTFKLMGVKAAEKNALKMNLSFGTNRPFVPVECPFMEGSLAYLQWKSGFDSKEKEIHENEIANLRKRVGCLQ